MTYEWKTEPNEVDFTAEGLPCKLRRGPLGHWCGYVGVPQDHPWHGLSYNSRVVVPKSWLENRTIDSFGVIDLFCHIANPKEPNEVSLSLALSVHGGITYSENHAPNEEPDGRFWFGFDCAHAGDLNPSSFERGYAFSGDVYRNQSYVVAECQSLAAQLAKVPEFVKASAT